MVCPKEENIKDLLTAVKYLHMKKAEEFIKTATIEDIKNVLQNGPFYRSLQKDDEITLEYCDKKYGNTDYVTETKGRGKTKREEQRRMTIGEMLLKLHGLIIKRENELHDQKMERKEIGVVSVDKGLPPGFGKKLGEYAGGAEGFLKRFLKGKASVDEVVAKRGDETDKQDPTNPSIFVKFLPNASSEELSEALTFAESMEMGDIAEKIKAEQSTRGKTGGKKRKTRKNRKTLRKRTRKI